MNNLPLLREALVIPFLDRKHLEVLFSCKATKASDISKKIKENIIKQEKTIWNGKLPQDEVEKVFTEMTGTTFEEVKSNLERMNFV